MIDFNAFTCRNVSEDIIKKFCLGYCTNSKITIFNPNGYSFSKEWLNYLEINKERYSNNLIYPIIDVSNKIVGLAFRGYSEKHFSFHDGCQKTRYLYGVHNSLNSIREKKFVVIVEGLFDVLVAHSYGITNIVGVFGNRISYHQACQIKRYTSNVLIIGDGDAGGKTLINKGTMMLKSVGINNIKSLCVEGKDPDELFISGQKFIEF